AFDISVVGRQYVPADRQVLVPVGPTRHEGDDADAGENQRTARTLLGRNGLGRSIVGGSCRSLRRRFILSRNRDSLVCGLRKAANLLCVGLSHLLLRAKND